MKYRFLVQTVLLISALVLSSCKGSKLYTKDNLPATRLEFGTYNAISGLKIYWIFLENGQVFYQTNLFMVEQKRLPKKTVKVLFEEAKRVQKSKFNINMDGNFSAFLYYQHGSNNNGVKWQWPYGGSKDYPDELSLLYRLCEDATKESAKEVVIE